MDELFTTLTNHGFWLSRFNSIGGQLSQIPCAGTCALYFSMLKVFGIAKEGKNNNNNKIKKIFKEQIPGFSPSAWHAPISVFYQGHV